MKTDALPQTDSIQELAQFWDTHDVTDFESEMEEVNERVFQKLEPRPPFTSNTFVEGFEFVIANMDEDKYDWEKEEYRTEYLNQIVKDLSDLGISQADVTIERTGVGVGAEADALAILILAGFTIVTGARRLFLAGKTINENVEGWVELAKTLRSALKKLKPDYVSQPFAAALALQKVIEKNPMARRFDLETAMIDVVPNSSMDMTGTPIEKGHPIQEIFRYQPMRYYTFSIRAYDDTRVEGYWRDVPSSVHLICVRSTGKIEFHHVLSVRDWVQFEGVGCE